MTQYTQVDLDRLEAALAKGVLRVEYDGISTSYNSIDDLRKAIAYVKGELNVAQGKPQRTTQTHAQFNRG